MYLVYFIYYIYKNPLACLFIRSHIDKIKFFSLLNPKKKAIRWRGHNKPYPWKSIKKELCYWLGRIMHYSWKKSIVAFPYTYFFFLVSSFFPLLLIFIYLFYQVWTIRVDIHFLDNDGNILDAASIAAILALAHFRRPEVSVTEDDLITIVSFFLCQNILFTLFSHFYLFSITLFLFLFFNCEI